MWHRHNFGKVILGKLVYGRLRIVVSMKKGYNALEDRKPLLKVKGDEVVENFIIYQRVHRAGKTTVAKKCLLEDECINLVQA